MAMPKGNNKGGKHMILEYENLKKRYEDNLKHLEEMCSTEACKTFPDLYRKYQDRIEIYQWLIYDLEMADLLMSMREQTEKEEANE